MLTQDEIALLFNREYLAARDRIWRKLNPPCKTYWGSHGCGLGAGHDGDHQCGSIETGLCTQYNEATGWWRFWHDEDGEWSDWYDRGKMVGLINLLCGHNRGLDRAGHRPEWVTQAWWDSVVEAGSRTLTFDDLEALWKLATGGQR